MEMGILRLMGVPDTSNNIANRAIGLMILICLPCIVRFISSSVPRLMKAATSATMMTLTVYPNCVDNDKKVDDDISRGSYSEMC